MKAIGRFLLNIVKVIAWVFLVVCGIIATVIACGFILAAFTWLVFLLAAVGIACCIGIPLIMLIEK